MFKKTIKYTDFNGVAREEEFAFHLSTPEVTRIEAKIGRELEDHIKQLLAEQDYASLMAFLEDIILSSYGRKSADGRSFKKSKELREEFEYSQAYAEFFEQLLTDPKLAEQFGTLVADNGKQRRNAVAPTIVE